MRHSGPVNYNRIPAVLQSGFLFYIFPIYAFGVSIFILLLIKSLFSFYHYFKNMSMLDFTTESECARVTGYKSNANDKLHGLAPSRGER